MRGMQDAYEAEQDTFVPETVSAAERNVLH